MYILDWFDLDNIEHLKAYKHLQDTGFWPKDFIPETVVFQPVLGSSGVCWSYMLTSKLANKFLEEKLNESTNKRKS